HQGLYCSPQCLRMDFIVRQETASEAALHHEHQQNPSVPFYGSSTHSSPNSSPYRLPSAPFDPIDMPSAIKSTYTTTTTTTSKTSPASFYPSPTYNTSPLSSHQPTSQGAAAMHANAALSQFSSSPESPPAFPPLLRRSKRRPQAPSHVVGPAVATTGAGAMGNHHHHSANPMVERTPLSPPLSADTSRQRKHVTFEDQHHQHGLIGLGLTVGY
ncbi:hypothetical protein HDU97_009653, partial [Phlyctochytrium planicorne]